MPEFQINYIAVFFAGLAQFALGALWYGPLFGKQWAQMVGLPATTPRVAIITRGMIFSFAGAMITAFVLAYQIYIWFPETWGIEAASTIPCYVTGSQAAFFVWLGYYLPQIITSIVWENRTWALLGINGLYYLLSLQIAGLILGCWV